jgi:hypothetical protein
MISIGKYLLSGDSADEPLPAPPLSELPQPDAVCPEVLLSLCSGLCDSINERVLTGERCEELRAQFADVRSLLRPDLSSDQATEIQSSTSQILASYQVAVQQAATNTAVEMQHILAMLNQGLMVLAGGSERSISRLQQIQQSLERTSMLRDIIALKSSLVEAVRFVQQESTREQETSARELAAFEADVRKARSFMGYAFKGLPGRPEAIRAITEELKAVPPKQALYAVAFLFDRLDAVVERYGDPVGDELMFKLIKERFQPLAPTSKTFRWTASSMVGLFCRVRDVIALRGQLAELSRTPMVHRVTVGNRVAVLTVSPSYLVIEALPDCPAQLIEEVDRFTGVHA